MASVLLIAQHLGGELNNSTSKAMACAKDIGDVTVAVFAESGQSVADAAATLGALRTKGLLPRPSDEARALHAWLRSHPSVVLELLPVSGSPVEAAAFRVRAT